MCQGVWMLFSTSRQAPPRHCSHIINAWYGGPHSAGWHLEGLSSFPVCFSFSATIWCSPWQPCWPWVLRAGDPVSFVLTVCWRRGERLWLISKAAYLRLYLALTGTKQQSAAPATDICYKSLAISSVASERQRKLQRERGKWVTKKRNRHLSLDIVYPICFYFEPSIPVLSLLLFNFRLGLPLSLSKDTYQLFTIEPYHKA